MASTAGTFTISLDFELYWGVHDHCAAGLLCAQPAGRPGRDPAHARAVRALWRALHLGDGRPPVLRPQGRAHGVSAGAAAALCQSRAFALSANRPDRAERAAGPLSLRPLADRADPGLPRPGDRHPHLLALLLPGAGRDRGRPERGDVSGRPAGGAPRRRAARHHAAQPGLPPQPVPPRLSRDLSRRRARGGPRQPSGLVVSRREPERREPGPSAPAG